MKRLCIAVLILACACLAAAQSHKRPNKTGDRGSAPDGARLFAVNCGRCHRPPDQLSPKISGSVLRHMRVRATLSKEDEQAILKYLAP